MLQAIATAVAVAIVDISGDCEVGGTGSACALGSGEVKAVAKVCCVLCHSPACVGL